MIDGVRIEHVRVVEVREPRADGLVEVTFRVTRADDPLRLGALFVVPVPVAMAVDRESEGVAAWFPGQSLPKLMLSTRSR